MKPKNLRELCDNPQLYEDEVTGYIFNGLWIKMVKELPLTWSVMNHKLNEWPVGFMDWIKSLPYSELITEEKGIDSND